MRYVSTRGKAPVLDFEGAMLSGLARDGGLYLPETIPAFSGLNDLDGLPYEEVAFRVIRLATRRHGELRTTPPESGELGLLNEHGDMSFERCMQAHDTLFHPAQHRKRKRSDTPAADALIRTASDWLLHLTGDQPVA